MQSVTLSLFRFGPFSARLWAFAQMGLSRFAFAKVRGIDTVKMCGSGTGEGFTPVPNTAVYGILATWPDHRTARRAIYAARPFRRHHEMSEQQLSIFLTPTSTRGRWAGVEPFVADPDAASDGPVAALTRANIKPTAATKFWHHEPNITKAIGSDPNVLFKIGIGELPLIRQVTFSIWPDTQTMAEFARRDGPHAKAIKAVREGGLFSEELYARFRVDAIEGTWNGEVPQVFPHITEMKVAAE